MDILIGTANPGKLREYRELLADIPATFISAADAGLASLDVDESADSFTGNALIKARAYAQASGLLTLADDSGLAVDALDGAPGVHSARYGGNGLDDKGRRQRLLAALADVPEGQRTARFVCVIALVDPSGQHDEAIVEGTVEGRIAFEDRDGPTGFGYDAVFVPEGHADTFAQLPGSVKHEMSHRGRAARQIAPVLRRIVSGR